MRRPRRPIQFCLRDLLVCVAMVAVLIQPAHLFVDWASESLFPPPTPAVAVPAGGLMMMVTPSRIVQEGETLIAPSVLKVPDGGRMQLVAPSMIVQEGETLIAPSTSDSATD